MSGGISFHLEVPNMDSLVCYLNLNNSNILVSVPIFPAKDRGIVLPLTTIRKQFRFTT